MLNVTTCFPFLPVAFPDFFQLFVRALCLHLFQIPLFRSLLPSRLSLLRLSLLRAIPFSALQFLF